MINVLPFIYHTTCSTRTSLNLIFRYRSRNVICVKISSSAKNEAVGNSFKTDDTFGRFDRTSACVEVKVARIGRTTCRGNNTLCLKNVPHLTCYNFRVNRF